MSTPTAPPVDIIQPGLNTAPGQDGFTAAVNKEAEALKAQRPTMNSNDDPDVFDYMEHDQMGEYQVKRKASDVMMDYYRWDYNTRQSFLNSLQGVGVDVSKQTDSQLAQKWADYVNQSAAYTSLGKPINPWAVIGMDIFSQEGRRKAEAEKGPVTATTSATTTMSDVNLSTQLDAKAMLYQASKTLLGRAPSDAETANFYAALNAQETANPQITTTTNNSTVTSTEGTVGGPGPSRTEETSQNRVTSGGLSADAKQMLVIEEAKKNPEYGAYQAATTFTDALKEMVYGKGY